VTVTSAEKEAMRRALRLATTPGVPLGPNPRVGCVLLADDGSVVAEGYHRGAGTVHAEADALARAGADARGTTAVVTLEPCNHTGRTGPCAHALIAAGARRVVFAQRDPNPLATGGAVALAAAGIDVEQGLLEEEASEINRAWSFGIAHGRPLVTWKFATSLDGRSAAADGTSRWISGAASRRDVHRLRAASDTILVGTGTATVDDPALTVRDEHDQPLAHQPLRAVMGLRELDPRLRLQDGAAETLSLRTHDPRTALSELFAQGRRHVFLEGGPTLAAAFVRAGLVDEVVAYLAPVLLGSGRAAVADLGIATIAEALRLTVTDVTILGGTHGEQRDVRLTLSLPSPSVDQRPHSAPSPR